MRKPRPSRRHRHYYSFEFGNIHYGLDSMDGETAQANGGEASWLRADLPTRLRDWGPSPSASSALPKRISQFRTTEMNSSRLRENISADLEAGGSRSPPIAGHSHAYRTFLSAGQPITMCPDPQRHEHSLQAAATFACSLPKAGRCGGPPGRGLWPWRVHRDKTSGGTLNHRRVSLAERFWDSLVIDVLTNQMNVTSGTKRGAVARDTFTILKSARCPARECDERSGGCSAFRPGQIRIKLAGQRRDEKDLKSSVMLMDTMHSDCRNLGVGATTCTETACSAKPPRLYRVRRVQMPRQFSLTRFPVSPWPKLAPR